MTEILESLEKNILGASEEIASHNVGSPEHTAAVKAVTELSRIYIDMDAKDRERMRADEAEATQEREREMKRDQQKWDNVFKIVTTGLNMAGKAVVAIGAGFVIVYGIAYEKHDNITSTVLKNVIKDITRIKL